MRLHDFPDNERNPQLACALLTLKSMLNLAEQSTTFRAHLYGVRHRVSSRSGFEITFAATP